MRKKGLVFLITALVGILIPVGFSTYVVIEDKEIDYTIDSGGNLVEPAANSITIDYNDGVTAPFEYKYDTFSYSSLPTPTANLSNHTFMGWYSTKKGVDSLGNSTALDSSYVPMAGDTIYARYKNSESISSTITSTVRISKNNAKTDNIYYFGSNDGASEIYINSGGTVQVYYGTSSTFDADNTGTDKSIKYLGEADVIVKLDCDLIINGGTFQINSVFGGDVGNVGNAISGSFTALDLNGYTITLMGSGNLNGYGIIYNSGETGGICIEDATLTTCFTPSDFTGGGYFCIAYVANVSPFTNYMAPYLCCEVLLTPMGTINAFTSLYANSTKNSTDFCLIGKSGSAGAMMEIENGYVIKRTTSYDKLVASFLDQYSAATFTLETEQKMIYDPEYYREELIFTDDPNEHLKYLDVVYPKTYQCQMTYEPLVMSLNFGIDITASMQYVEFPIPSYFDLKIYNTEINVNMGIVFMPGSTCYVDEDSTVNLSFTTGAGTISQRIFGKIGTVDHYPKDVQYLYKSDSSGKSSIYGGLDGFLPSKFLFNQGPAKVTMNGRFTFDASSVNKSSEYVQWYCLFGHMDLSDQALKSIKDNYSILEIGPRYYFPSLSSYTDDNYDLGVAEYGTMPLVGGTHAYFQPGGKFTEIVACEDYDVDAGLYKYNGQWYFYKFTTESSYTGLHLSKVNILLTDHNPTAENLLNKYNNTAGAYTACDVYTLDSILGEVKYIKYSGNYRVNIRGAFIQTISQPSMDSNGSINRLTISSSTSNKLNDSENNSSYCKLGTSIYFEPSTLHWRLDYAS